MHYPIFTISQPCFSLIILYSVFGVLDTKKILCWGSEGVVKVLNFFPEATDISSQSKSGVYLDLFFDGDYHQWAW